MIDGIQQQLFQYGLAGVVIFALGWFLLRTIEEHKKDRERWGSQIDKLREENNENRQQMFDRVSDMADQQNQITRENTNILTSLKTLLESKLK